MQTAKIDHFPIILFGKSYWQNLIDWLRDPVAQRGMIAETDLDLLRLTDDNDEALAWILESFAEADAAQLEIETGRDQTAGGSA